MIRALLPAVWMLLSAAPASAATLDLTRDLEPWRWFAEAEYVAPQGGESGMRAPLERQVAGYRSSGWDTIRLSSKSAPAFGVRGGVLYWTGWRHWEAGASLGYLHGPRFEGLLEAGDPSLGRETNRVVMDHRFLRLLGEARRAYEWKEWLAFHVRGALGLAYGMADFTNDGVEVGDVYFSESDSASAFGPAWELGVGVDWMREHRTWSFGVRACGVPSLSGKPYPSADPYEPGWIGYGFYVGTFF